MKNGVYETSFGRKIPCIDGYRSAHRIGHKCLESEFTEEETVKRVGGNMSFVNFRKDMVEYTLMKDFLQSVGCKNTWESTLDVGGREGTVARLLKGTGAAKHTESIDIFPFQQRLNTSLFKKHFREIYAPKRGPFRIPRSIAGIWNTSYKNWAHPQHKEFGFEPSEYFGWDLSLSKAPEVDTYHTDDFLTATSLKNYDLISSLLTIMYFDPDTLFAKVASLLQPGGIFVFLVDYWWFPVNSMDIVGDFPYACQRMTKSDVQKYFHEYYPKEEPFIMKRYDSFHKGVQPTLRTYEELARKNGLSLRGEKRLIPPNKTGNRTPLMPSTLQHYQNSNLEDVLEDINCFRDDVQMSDLKTAFVLMAFEKLPEKEPRLEKRIEKLPSIHYGSYDR